MPTIAPELINDNNLSYAWARAFLSLIDRSKGGTAPLVISIGGFKHSIPSQDAKIRDALDRALARQHKFSSDVSASVIFPYKPWLRSGCAPSTHLFEWYKKEFLPRLKARDPRNRNGTYFERMVAYQGVQQRSGKTQIRTTNQLEHILHIWQRDSRNLRRPRRSALQVACFDPAKDHTGQPVRGFPCLQQVSFTYDDDKGLAVNAFYPTQYLFDRGYGNYLGLCHLGHFMAHELALRLVRLNCFIACPEIGNVPKASLLGLTNHLRRVLEGRVS